MATDDFTATTPATTPAVDTPTPVADEIAPPQEPVWNRSHWLWLGVLLVLGLSVPFLPVPNKTVAFVGAIAFTILYVIAVVQFAALASRHEWPIPNLLAIAIFCGVLWGLTMQVVSPMIGEMLLPVMKSGERLSSGQLLMAFSANTIQDLALLGTAVFGGSIVARLIKTPNMLGPICAIIAMIDIWGVMFGGIVSQLLTNPATAEASRKAMATVPTLGAASPEAAKYAIPQLTIGVGDYLFLGLLFAALHLNGMNWRGTVKLVIPLIVVVLLLAQFMPMPGLLPIGLGFAIPNWKYFEYTREEKFALIYAGGFVLVLTVALFFGLTSIKPPHNNAANNKGAPKAAPNVTPAASKK